MELLNNRIQEIDGVISTETLISLEQSFSRQVPILFPDSADDADMAAACAFARKLAKPDHLVDDPEDADTIFSLMENFNSGSFREFSS